MKRIFTAFTLLTLALSGTAQQRISCTYTAIKKVQAASCSDPAIFVKNSQVRKQAGRLTIPIAGKPVKVFRDDHADERLREYAYLGDVKSTSFSLVTETGYNDETFLLVSRSTGAVHKLIGPPVFALNMQGLACVNNPGTDKKQEVQVCEIKNGVVSTRIYLNAKEGVFLTDIVCVYDNAILAKDSGGKYWRLDFLQ
ncbi:hypothetical protein SAMN05428949_1012 [Chitinophaga sp. YR627]|uniref:hypothetical protein n=1 Tax=Chitinophaga sp. YR627 TaxID=1881041 RepID=UPI0008EC739C|nr:hypothetical protein [Chitinophaga sp. YR627]SFM84563.1 hypothetical protein SAMN05428949_1012 [Chitinophaga sp. YR627]